MKEILEQIELIEGMELDTRTECFMQLQQVKKLKILLQKQVKNCSTPDVVGQSEQLCINCKESNANRGLGEHKLLCRDCWNSLCD